MSEVISKKTRRQKAKRDQRGMSAAEAKKKQKGHKLKAFAQCSVRINSK